MRSERAPTARRYWLALLFLILGTAVGVWHNRRVSSGRSDPLAGIVRNVVSAPVRGLRSTSSWFGKQTDWITHGRQISEENRQLREQVATLQGENNTLTESQIELQRLRDDLGFIHSKPVKLIAADIIAMRTDPKFDTMVIGRGSNDGIKSNSVVVTRDGVVGRVFEVGSGTASVLMLTDQKSGIGIRIQRSESRAIGICEGDNTSSLSMVGLPDTADIKVGDVVVTSGLGGVFPGGLMVGTINEIKPNISGEGKIVRVKPQVAFDRLEQVYVIP